MKPYIGTQALSVALTTLSGAILGGLVAGKPGAIGGAVAGGGTGLALQFEEPRNCHAPVAQEVMLPELGVVVGAGMGAGAGWALGHPKAGAVVGTVLGLAGGFVLGFLGGATGQCYDPVPVKPAQVPAPTSTPGPIAGFAPAQVVYR